MRQVKIILVCSLLCAWAAMVTIGCEKEGPAEKAGKKMDEAIESAKKSFKKLTGD